MHNAEFECVVIGVSAGGMTVLQVLLPELPVDFPIPIIVVQHLHPQQGNFHIKFYNDKSKINVVEAQEKELITSGNVYFAPANYHLLIEYDKTFSLSVDEKVNYSRPSIDVLFDTALDVYKDKLLAIILTGANNDGANAMKRIKDAGGYTIVQDPLTAEVNAMPLNAIRSNTPSEILPIDKIVDFLLNLAETN